MLLGLLAAFVLLIFAVGYFLIVIVWPRQAKRWQESFNSRFPAISDAEFIARCSPGTNPEVALRVRQVLAESIGVECERIYPSSRLIQDLDAG
jgi:hypothetical protein